MTPEERKWKRLEKLSAAYELARGVCDPLDFPQRQKWLLYEIAECLLDEVKDLKPPEDND